MKMLPRVGDEENTIPDNSGVFDKMSPSKAHSKRLPDSPITVINRSLARRTSSRHSSGFEYSDDSDEEGKLKKDASFDSLVVSQSSDVDCLEPNWTEKPPIQLVTGSNGLFKLTPEGRAYFTETAKDRKVVIITVCGLYRTGKSYLLNLISGRIGPLNHQSGPLLATSSAVGACTAGIWVWGSVPRANEPLYLLVDCEGSGNTANTRDHDSRLFAIAMLMSSYFIYNSKGVIDDPAISNLSLVASLAASTVSLASSACLIQRSKPKFMWVLRDFVVALESADGAPISAFEYLENSLRGKPYRKPLMSIFSSIDCSTLVTPVMEESKLQNLTELGWSVLRPEFRSQMVSLRSKIFRDARIKRSLLDDKDLTGSDLLVFLESVIKAINSNEVPRIESIWTQMELSQDEQKQVVLLANYDMKIRTILLPLDVEKLETEFDSARRQIFAEFKVDEDAIIMKNKNVIAQNELIAKEKAEHLLKTLWKEEVVSRLVPGLSNTDSVKDRIAALEAIFFAQAVGPPQILKRVYEDNIFPRVEKLIVEFKNPLPPIRVPTPPMTTRGDHHNKCCVVM